MASESSPPEEYDYYAAMEALGEGQNYTAQKVDHSAHHGHGGHGGHDMHGMHGMHGMDHGGHMMMMNFHWQHKGVIFLFEKFKIDNTTHLFVACVVTVLMGVLVESIKKFRLDKANARLHGTRATYRAMHALDSGLHFIQTTIGYLLMLIAMTYHYLLFFSAMFGIALGYWAFNLPEEHEIDVRVSRMSRFKEQLEKTKCELDCSNETTDEQAEYLKRGSVTQDNCC